MTLLRRFKSLSQTTNPSINVAVEHILILLSFVAILLDGLFYSHVFLGLLFLSVITTCMIWGDLLLCLAFHPSSSWPNFHSGNQCKYWAFLKVGDLSKNIQFLQYLKLMQRLGVQKQFCLNHGDQMADQIRPKHLHSGEPGRQMAYKEQQLQMMGMRTVES